MIPAEAVEAAAQALAIQAWGQWEYVPNELRKAFIRDAKITLEAAAPYIRAQALEDAAAEVDEGVPAYGQGEYADWLRAQAAAERGTHGNH